MNVAELKTDLIQLILETDNPGMLEKIMAYIRKQREQEDWWDSLSENEKSFLERSSRQIDEGKVVPNEDFRSEINRMLKKN